MSETATETQPGADAGTPGVDDLDPAAALGAAIHGGTVTPSADAVDTSDEALVELAKQRKEGSDAEKAAAEIKWWKAQARRNENRLKEANGKLTEAEQRDMTELQKERARAVAAEERAARAERRIWVSDAADAYEIPAKFRSRITGDTEAEIEASAESLAKDLNEMRAEFNAGQNSQQPGRPGAARGRRPVEALRPGGQPASDVITGTSGNDMIRGLINRATGRA
jgi:hypothetical protein